MIVEAFTTIEAATSLVDVAAKYLPGVESKVTDWRPGTVLVRLDLPDDTDPDVLTIVRGWSIRWTIMGTGTNPAVVSPQPRRDPNDLSDIIDVRTPKEQMRESLARARAAVNEVRAAAGSRRTQVLEEDQ